MIWMHGETSEYSTYTRHAKKKNLIRDAPIPPHSVDSFIYLFCLGYLCLCLRMFTYFPFKLLTIFFLSMLLLLNIFTIRAKIVRNFVHQHSSRECQRSEWIDFKKSEKNFFFVFISTKEKIFCIVLLSYVVVE